MSSTLYFRAVPKDLPPASSASSLKHLLGPKLWGGNWSSAYGLENTATATADLIPYLEGIRDAGNEEMREDADDLIAALKEHGEVDLWIGG